MNGVYLVIDTEFCGPRPEKNGLIQLAAAALNANFDVIDHFVVDVQPPEGAEILQANLDFAGFDFDRIKDGVSYDELASRIEAFVAKHFQSLPIAVAQFYPADFMHLNHLFGETGKMREMWSDILGNDFIDTKSIANQHNAVARMNGDDIPFPVTSLSKTGGLRDVLGIDGYQAHDALGDVLATCEVLKKLIQYSA